MFLLKDLQTLVENLNLFKRMKNLIATQVQWMHTYKVAVMENKIESGLELVK